MHSIHASTPYPIHLRSAPTGTTLEAIHASIILTQHLDNAVVRAQLLTTRESRSRVAGAAAAAASEPSVAGAAEAVLVATPTAA
jgi:hypothetical protein